MVWCSRRRERGGERAERRIAGRVVERRAADDARPDGVADTPAHLYYAASDRLSFASTPPLHLRPRPVLAMRHVSPHVTADEATADVAHSIASNARTVARNRDLSDTVRNESHSYAIFSDSPFRVGHRDKLNA